MIILRIRNILLFILALFKVSFSPRKKEVKTPNRIIVIQPAKLGDMVCTTPVFHAIKQKFPKSKLYVMGDKINGKLLEGNQDIDEYVVFAKDSSIFKLGKRLKKENIDVCVIVGPNYVSLLIAIFSGIRSIIAPRPVGGKATNTRTYSALILFVHTREFKFGAYAPRERLRLLEPLDIFTEDTTKHLTFSADADTKAEELFSKHKDKMLVGITLSAGNKIKEWPTERFAEVANHVASKYGVVIVIIGGPNDTEYSQMMRGSLNKEVQYIDTTGTLSIDELKATISKLDLFISVDTGPIYIAEAFNIPTVDIVGPMDEREQPPIGKFHKCVITDRKKPELHILNARVYNVTEAKRQIETITTNQVMNTIQRLL
jgi:ADP-heptose:LPS heptosyltransferase